MSLYNLVWATDQSTVVAEYEATYAVRPRAYQSEAELEAEFVRNLASLGYEVLAVKDERALVENLRHQLERLNNMTFSDAEWQRFFAQNIANPGEGIVEKTRKIQEDYIQLLRRDDGTTKNIYLLNKTHIHENRLQVINQYATDEGAYANRYDVTILVNGLPLVHVELKRRGVPLKEAFNQINRYQRESFWAGMGLFEYVQLFVISNGTYTRYYSNTTRAAAIRERTKVAQKNAKRTSQSFEFTSVWADSKNKVIDDLVGFTKTFFAKHTLLSVLLRYCVFTSENLLLVMRPYQIAATERILNRIVTSSNYKKMGSVDAGGYIWHTTGSGKTLTSFKTAQLATGLAGVEKVLFVVDRKDLDYQTMREYDRFQKGAANGNRNTEILKRQLEDDAAKIIVTTIQKLDTFIKGNRRHPVYKKHVVLIFDECHRSQFGDMHSRIVKSFRNYHIFGFTGTPIFALNASSGGNPLTRTTAQVFGDCLHTYTIVNAIADGNVLPFRIDYVNTVRMRDNASDAAVEAINTEEVLASPERIRMVVDYIIEHFDQKTKRNSSYSLHGQRVRGFNSIFAVSSIPVARLYYLEFQRQLKERGRDLTVATIFSFAANEEVPEMGIIEDESMDPSRLDQSSREFLEDAIGDYNRMFKTNFDTSSHGFQDYYKDVSERMKKREVDLLIVVNMFLTGFDATTLNTLWVDKNLRQHGLIQAFSRTNRILNSVKTYGNIVCFRNLEKETQEAVSLFGDENASGVVLLRSYEDYYSGYVDDDGEEVLGYTALVEKLQTLFPLGETIIGESAEKEFIATFGAILRLRNILTSFDQFAEMDPLSPRDLQDFTSRYNALYEKYRPRKKESESVVDDIVFEMELVKQTEVNIDYILMLVEKYHKGNCENKEILVDIDRAIGSSTRLRSKRELIQNFIERINTATKIDDAWRAFVIEERERQLQEIITEERLDSEKTHRYMDNALRNGVLRTNGTELNDLMPPASRFGKIRATMKETIIERLTTFFEKFEGLGGME